MIQIGRQHKVIAVKVELCIHTIRIKLQTIDARKVNKVQSITKINIVRDSKPLFPTFV
jgi:hypothetical protein